MNTKLLLLAALAVTASLPAADAPAAPCVSCCAEVTPAAPLSRRSIYQLDAKWTDDTGATVKLATLRGEPVIVAMFFAQCEYACPMLVADIRRTRELLAPDIRARARVVLVSFDTVRDTPAALAAYRGRAGLDASWTLLRGEEPAVEELAMLLGVKFKRDGRGQFAHSNLVTILNKEGEIAHQRAGLQGDMSEVAHAITVAAR